MTTCSTDLLEKLADIAPDSALKQARDTRDAATRHAQGSYDALFTEQDGVDFSLAERLRLAQNVARWHGDSQLTNHYSERLQDLPRDAVIMSAQMLLVMAFAAVVLASGYWAYLRVS